MRLDLDYPQRQSHPFTIHHLNPLDPNSACCSDKQTNTHRRTQKKSQALAPIIADATSE